MHKVDGNLELLEMEKKSGSAVCNSMPIIMWLESTSRCNLKCITCPRTYLPFFKGKDLEDEVIGIVKAEMFPYLRFLNLHDFGEPMLAKNLEYLFDEAVKNNINISLSTNGMLLTEKWIRKFLEHGIRFWISLDGTREETFQKIRRGASLQEVIEGIRLFNRLKEAEYKGSGSSISLVFVALKSNISELPGLVSFAKELNIASLKVQHFNFSIQDLSMRRESLRYDKQLANHYFMLAKKKADELGLNLEVSLYEERVKKEPRGTGYRFPMRCFAPWEKIVIRANGDVAPCCGSGEIMGNIKKTPFRHLWNSGKYKKLRRSINTNFPPLDCRNCVQANGINAGNPENTKCSEPLGYRLGIFFEHKFKLARYGYQYLKYYL